MTSTRRVQPTEGRTAATVGVVTDLVTRRYPVELAEAWDAVGLVCGDRGAEVDTVLFVVDVDHGTVDEAIDVGATLVVAHHPLLLSPVHGIPADDPRGGVVHRLVRSGIALLTAHTNADAARHGVSDSLAGVVGLTVTAPILVGASPDVGIGRWGRLEGPITLSDLASRLSGGLPPTAGGIRISGDPGSSVRTVAVCGGSGDSLLDAVRSLEVDVYVTADLRHHRVIDHRAAGGGALIDVAHWASEWPWLAVAADLLEQDAAGVGATVRTVVSTRATDPWTWHLANEIT